MARKQPMKYFVSSPGARPVSYLIDYFLWGNDGFDSDGEADFDDDDQWTELYIFHRERENESVSINSIKSDPLILEVSATQQHLAAQAAFVLRFTLMER